MKKRSLVIDYEKKKPNHRSMVVNCCQDVLCCRARGVSKCRSGCEDRVLSLDAYGDPQSFLTQQADGSVVSTVGGSGNSTHLFYG